VHDFLTVGAAAPLQEAGALALRLPPGYYRSLREKYVERREKLWEALIQAGFKCYKPQGAYYIMTHIGHFGFENDVQFVRHLIENAGVAAVPGSSFYSNPRDGAQLVRFCFCKKDETLEAASLRLRRAALR